MFVINVLGVAFSSKSCLATLHSFYSLKYINYLSADLLDLIGGNTLVDWKVNHLNIIYICIIYIFKVFHSLTRILE